MQTQPRTRGELTHDKLLLLYALSRLGPATGEQLLRFIIELDLMGYLEYALSLAELTDAHLLLLLDDEPGRVYHVTRKGGEALSYFKRRILPSKKEAVDAAAPAWREAFERESLFRADIRPCPSGQFAVRLRARTPDEPLIDLTLYASTHAQAVELSASWRERAAAVYRCVVDMLSP